MTTENIILIALFVLFTVYQFCQDWIDGSRNQYENQFLQSEYEKSDSLRMFIDIALSKEISENNIWKFIRKQKLQDDRSQFAQKINPRIS